MVCVFLSPAGREEQSSHRRETLYFLKKKENEEINIFAHGKMWAKMNYVFAALPVPMPLAL